VGFLSGIRIIDVTRGLAGPFATHAMTDYGAEIIRVDPPGAVRSGFELVHLRGRRSIAVNLDSDEGLDVVRRLIATGDVLVTEPALDGKALLPWTYAELAADNPRLISCRLTGYGDDGPQVNEPVNDRLVAARYGVDNQAGWRPGPTFIVAPIPSLGAGLLAVQGIGVALYQRERTGRGQDVMVSLMAGAFAFMPGTASSSQGPVVNYANLVGRGPLGQAPFYSLYECADGEYVHLACLMPAFQQRAIDALEIRPELEALHFGTEEGIKPENHHKIVETIGDRIRSRPFAHWSALFEEHDIPHARSQWTEDLLDDPQIAAEGLALTFDDPTVGPMTQHGSHVTVTGVEWQQPTPAPLPGQHTDEVLTELGFDAAQIAPLRAAGAVA
jgi:crotonobetainyl-CoA:carnitine CoA-transferase CaiB-like acyl-CoA transferase